MASTSTDNIVKLQDLSLSYGNEQVLLNLSLAIPRGSVVKITGPNGSGKTSLLRLLLGLIRPTSGIVLRNWESVAYVPQQRELDPLYPISVWDLVTLGGRRKLLKSPTPTTALEDLLKSLSIWEHRYKRFGELSGGMKQKSLIARSLFPEPELLVFDEAFSELDQPASQFLLDEISRRNNMGLTSIVVLQANSPIALNSTLTIEFTNLTDKQLLITSKDDA